MVHVWGKKHMILERPAHWAAEVINRSVIQGVLEEGKQAAAGAMAISLEISVTLKSSAFVLLDAQCGCRFPLR